MEKDATDYQPRSAKMEQLRQVGPVQKARRECSGPELMLGKCRRPATLPRFDRDCHHHRMDYGTARRDSKAWVRDHVHRSTVFNRDVRREYLPQDSTVSPPAAAHD